MLRRGRPPTRGGDEHWAARRARAWRLSWTKGLGRAAGTGSNLRWEVSPGGQPAVARRRPTAAFVRGTAALAKEPETFVYSWKAGALRADTTEAGGCA